MRNYPYPTGNDAQLNTGQLNQYRLPVLLSIPPGDFLMGTSVEDIRHLQLKQSDWAYDWSDNDLFTAEQPQHPVTLPAFEIAIHPVTNLEYSLFVWDTGYQLPKSWNGFSFPDELGNHPVVAVSKVDAEAYIRWLNGASGQSFRLPSEAEWERAARGTDGRIYPWGNMFDPWRCNTSESAKRGTTPAGVYSPGGDSPCGAADMVGNVWEWTRSNLLPYPFRDDRAADDSLPYVIRGGSWYYSRKLARCAAREGMAASTLSMTIGFRLARSST